MGVATPSRHVVATALRPPLQLSHSILEFHLPSGYFDLGIESGAGRAQVSVYCVALGLPCIIWYYSFFKKHNLFFSP